MARLLARRLAQPVRPAPGLAEAVINSLVVAFLSTLVATILGTLIALALVRYQFRGRGATNMLIFLPMATPEIVLGASLLTMFVATASTAVLSRSTSGRSSSPTSCSTSASWSSP